MIIVNINGTEYQVSIAAGLNISVSNTKYPKVVRGDFFLSASVENSEGTEISPVVSGQTLTLPDVEVIVRYSNGVIAQTFENEPAGVNLDLTTGIFPPYEPELLAKIAYAEANAIPLPTALDLAKENNFIFLQKQFGVINITDIMYWFAGTGVLVWKGINIINPNSGFNITWVGGVINTLQGVEGNALNAYGSTNYIPTLNGGYFTEQNASRSFYVYKQPNTVGIRLVDYNRSVAPQINSPSNQFGLNGSNSAQLINYSSVPGNLISAITGVDYYCITRDGLTAKIRKGITDYNLTVNGSIVGNTEFQILGTNLAGGSYSNAGLAYYRIGANLSNDLLTAERSNILASL